MKFGKLQAQVFGTPDGAYSAVTKREVRDSQITLTDYEADLVIRHFGQGNIYVGNVRSGRFAACKQFLLHPSAIPVELNLVYPKPARRELRLYLRRGFKPRAGDIWFVYRKDGKIYLGAMPEKMWRSLGREDADDAQYVALAADEATILPVAPRIVTAVQYARKIELARERFKLAKYRCEFDAGHKLFKARATGLNFLEPHHLVMVSLCSQFPGQNLDVLDNIYALCPWCHRAVHHAEPALVSEILLTLLQRRPQISQKLAIKPEEVLRLYNCEQITK